jgi:methionyl-tRNA formyltransferase
VRVAFVGLPLAAILLAGDGHTIVWAGASRIDAPGLRRLRRLLGAASVECTPDLSHEDVVTRVREARPELLVSWFWTKRIPPLVLGIPPLGAIGVHPSLLPRHRGTDPYFWAIEAGDATTGVTAHLLAEEYDTGPILEQRTVDIDPSWNAWTLARKLDRPSLALLREIVHAYAEGRPPSAKAQDEAYATAAPAPGDELLALRWSAAAEAIVRRVRAASPWPGAFTAIGDAPVAITDARVTHDFPAALAPGEAAVRADGVAVVRAGTDAVELLGGRLEGPSENGGDAVLDAHAFAKLVARARSS